MLRSEDGCHVSLNWTSANSLFPLMDTMHIFTLMWVPRHGCRNTAVDLRLCAAEYVGHFAHVGVFLARKGKCRRCFSFNSCCTLDLRRSRLEARTLGVGRMACMSVCRETREHRALPRKLEPPLQVRGQMPASERPGSQHLRVI